MVQILLQSSAQPAAQLPEETPYMVFSDLVSCSEARLNEYMCAAGMLMTRKEGM